MNHRREAQIHLGQQGPARIAMRWLLFGILFGVILSASGAALPTGYSDAIRPSATFGPGGQLDSLRATAAYPEEAIVRGSGGPTDIDTLMAAEYPSFFNTLMSQISADLHLWVADPLKSLLFNFPGIDSRITQMGGLQPLLSDGQFVWGPNVGHFDIFAYLETRDSPLSVYADDIAGWANYSSVNPKFC